jgi:hypothetical protein
MRRRERLSFVTEVALAIGLGQEVDGEGGEPSYSSAPTTGMAHGQKGLWSSTPPPHAIRSSA